MGRMVLPPLPVSFRAMVSPAGQVTRASGTACFQNLEVPCPRCALGYSALSDWSTRSSGHPERLRVPGNSGVGGTRAPSGRGAQEWSSAGSAAPLGRPAASVLETWRGSGAARGSPRGGREAGPEQRKLTLRCWRASAPQPGVPARALTTRSPGGGTDVKPRTGTGATAVI